MAEIGIDDLPDSVRAKFVDVDAAQAAVDAVLAAARRHCGWHVSPVKTGDVLTLDGPGVQLLDLPTLKLNAVTSMVEDGTTLDVAKLNWSENGSIRKRSGGCWTHWYRAVVATITHGFTEAEAADWRKAIIEMVGDVADQMTDSAGEETSGPLKRKKVNNVEYEWSESEISTAADDAVYTVQNVLEEYRLSKVLFA